MTMILKDCKIFVNNWKQTIKTKIEELERAPQLAIIQVGNIEASNRYVKNKIKDCEEVGIIAHHFHFTETDFSQQDLVAELILIRNSYDGIIIQLPLPADFDVKFLTDILDPIQDVDGFGPYSPHKPCTPGGIMKYLEYCGWDPTGKDVTIIGRSDIVGKPLAKLMTDANATVTLCHSKTRNIDRHVVGADLIVSAVGKRKFLNCYAIHVPVIDVGINFDENGKLCGDCYNTENRDVTPVPGGVGLMTRCMLLENVYNAAVMRRGIEDEKNLEI